MFRSRVEMDGDDLMKKSDCKCGAGNIGKHEDAEEFNFLDCCRRPTKLM